MTDNTESNPQASLLQGFGGLEGIQEARNVHARDKITLDKLINIKEEMLKLFHGELLCSKSYFNDTYKEMYEQVKTRLRYMDFNEQDISYFVLAESNTDYNKPSAIVLGLYTGCLAHALTERNNAIGKRTTIYIDGRGNKFDHLFCHAKLVDNLIVENFKGVNICSWIGSDKGYADKVIGINIEGKHALSSIGHQGNVNQVIGIAINGNLALSFSGADYGGINQVIAINIIGDEALGWTAFDGGKVNQLVCAHVNGSSILQTASWNFGTINQFVCYDVSQFADTFIQRCQKNDPEIGGVNKIIRLTRLDEGEKMFNLHCEYNARHIIQFAKSMQGKPYQEILAIADEIYKLRPEVPEGFFEKDKLTEKDKPAQEGTE